MGKFKKIFAFCLVAMMGLTACGANPESSTESKTTTEPTSVTTETEQVDKEAKTTDKRYKIGLIQSAKHPALDEAHAGFVEQLDALGIDYDLDYQDAQGDLRSCIHKEKMIL